MNHLLEYFRKKSQPVMFQALVTLTGASGGPDLGKFLTAVFKPQDLTSFFNGAFRTAIVVGAILAVLRIAYAGFIYMTTDLWPAKQSATQIIQDAVVGLLLLLAIWIILMQINPQILNLHILDQMLQSPGSGQTGQPGAPPCNASGCQ